MLEKHLDKLRGIPDKELRMDVDKAIEVFPERLREIRVNANMVLKDTARGTGIQWQTISAYERGESLPNFVNLRLLASYYGVTVDWLMGGEWN